MYYTLMQSQIFFFISSIGFIILWFLALIFLFYLIKSMKTFSRLMDKIEKDIEHIGDTSKDILEDVRESSIFNFFFRKSKKYKKKKE